VMPLYIRAAVSVSSLISVQRFSPPVAFFPRRTNRGGNQGGGGGGRERIGAGRRGHVSRVRFSLSEPRLNPRLNKPRCVYPRSRVNARNAHIKRTYPRSLSFVKC